MKNIYFVAGEASADNHGAALIRSLREFCPELKFIGRGGPQMRQLAGAQFKNWVGDAAVLGLWEVLRKYGYFREQFRETLKEIRESKPDAVVLIDYPGFNLRLARALRSTTLSLVRPPGLKPADSDASEKISADRTRQSPMFRPKTIYYIGPQVWAWNPGRVKRMAQSVDLVLCIFPFEADRFKKSGIPAVFVGHPMMETLQARKIDAERDPNLIGLFPGSRSREIRKIFPMMMETARQLLQRKPTLRFQVAAASEELAREIKTMWRRHHAGTVEGLEPPATIEIKVGETAEIMQRAYAGIVASGTATLEAAYFRMPFVLVYKVAWPTYLAARAVVNVNYLGMPNLLADKQVVPEFIQQQAKPGAIAKALWPLLEDNQAREQMILEFDAIITQLGGSGASEHAARSIVEELNKGQSCARPGGLSRTVGT